VKKKEKKKLKAQSKAPAQTAAVLHQTINVGGAEHIMGNSADKYVQDMKRVGTKGYRGPFPG
jgi:hypothetical protein